MSNRRTLMAAAAMVLAAVAGFAVFFYASSADKRAEDKVGLVEAWVAAADIARGTTGEQVVQAQLVRLQKVARASLPPSRVQSIEELRNKVAAGRIDTGQFITAQTFVDKNDAGGGLLANAIARDDLVAVTVDVAVSRGVAGQIAPGDRVDVARKGEDGGAIYVLRGVKVLAVGLAKVGQGADPSAAAIENSNLITCELTSEDALTLISTAENLYLTLLPPGVTPSATTPATAAVGSR